MNIEALKKNLKHTAPGLLGIDAMEIVIGKDVMELLSSAMYVEPMSVYREYIQNAADAIDDARMAGLLAPDEPGRVNIEIDPVSRTISFHDNGTGIAWPDFVPRLTTLGSSSKRNSSARGFRGVGRLAGLGYAQELVFRSRTPGEPMVSEMRWDCRKLRVLLRTQDELDLPTLISAVVSVGRIEGEGWPERFFQTEMRGIVRLKADRLMDAGAIDDYLAQVAPVPFSSEFPFAELIRERLDGVVRLGEIDIRISGRDAPIRRPHRAGFVLDETRTAAFTDIEFFELPSVDGGLAAICWVLHHDYVGALHNNTGIKGLRLRSGNIQIGEATLLEELFPEARFNSWCVGEVHVVDRRLVPNGRRDHFEQNNHYANLLNHLAPITREISRRCRTGSVRRKLRRDFSSKKSMGEERLAVIEQGAMNAARREELVRETVQLQKQMQRIVSAPALLETDVQEMSAQVAQIESRIADLRDAPEAADALAPLPAEKRSMYEHMFDLIYSCSTNRMAAKALIDRIIEKIT
jgi:molecular chaperone HtpG